MSDSSKMGIVDFYNDSVILISGATGFMGRILLEKILYDLKPKKIYLLIRPKRGLDAKLRLNKILEEKIFDRVRRSDRINCIEPIGVDFEQDDFTLSEDCRRILSEEVNAVFCLSATVKFDEELADALRINVIYNQKLLQLVSSFRQLKSVLYVSTFYSNCNQAVVEEKIYRDEAFESCCSTVEQMVAQMGSSMQESAISKIPEDFPNTYTYSKKLTELMISKFYRDLPIGIYRPPIVICTYNEPLPAWIDNLNGPSVMIAFSKLGIVLGLCGDLRKKPFLTPVDYCANAMISCAVDVFNRNLLHPEEVPVYNYTDDIQNVRWKDVSDAALKNLPASRRYFHRYVLPPMSTNRFLISTEQSIMRLQGYLGDLFTGCTGKHTARMKKVLKIMKIMKYGCSNEWKMHNSNMIGVIDGLSDTETATFPCDLRKIDWNDLLKIYVESVERLLELKAATAKQ